MTQIGGSSWGRYPPTKQQALWLRSRGEPLPETDTSVLPYGNGRSYGDVCLNDGGALLHMRALKHLIAFDADSGVLRCEAGVLLSEILDFCVPRGWFLPVTPGTRLVTVGGAIANDVHGKNHHVAGSFGCHVRAFELLRSDGQRLLCSAETHADWFAASIGGLGLTGVITWAEIVLKPIAGPWLNTHSERFDSLAQFFALSEAANVDHEYTAAWVDCSGGAETLGRGIFTCADHASGDASARGPKHGTRFSVPFTPPVSLINRASTRAFNWLHFHRHSKTPSQATQHYQRWLYPLDAIGHWNRLYGPRGFLQYQCVIPPAAATDAVPELLQRIAASGHGSPLTVLKQFGPRQSLGLLSFPRQGTTLALDFPNRGNHLHKLLDSLDDIVTAANGAVYPAKDARLDASHFRQYFPQWETFSAFVDPRFSSGFWRRVNETQPP